MKITDLKANPKNPRIIKDDKFKKLVKSLQEFPEMMEKRPMVCVTDVDGKLFPLGGNMRLKALQELKYKEIPDEWVMLADEWTVEKRQEFVIKDNLAMGEWDWELLTDMFDVSDLEDWGVDLPELEDETPSPEAKEDDYEIPDEIETDIVLGDLFEIGEHRLLCGDSTDSDSVAKLMNGEKADMVMTDPPYNVDYSSKNKMLNYADNGKRIEKDIENDKMDNNSFYQFMYDFYTVLASYTKEGGVWYVWYSEKEKRNFTSAFEDANLYLSQNLIWVKNNIVLGRMDYQPKHETCLYGWKKGAGHYFTDDRTKTTVIEDKIDPKKLKKDELLKIVEEMLSDKVKTTVLRADKPLRSDLHPTMKPILLLSPLIENSSKIKEIVADGFLGSGSTMVASHQLKRKCYGMELDSKYAEVIVRRMIKLDNSLTIKRNGVDETQKWLEKLA